MNRWTTSRATPPLIRRLESILRNGGVAVPEGLTTEAAVARVDALVDGLLVIQAHVSDQSERLREAFVALPTTALLFAVTSSPEGPRSELVVRSAKGTDFVGGLSSPVPLQQVVTVVDRVIASGEHERETVLTLGPPRRTYAIDAVPVRSQADVAVVRAVVVTVDDVSAAANSEAMRRDLITNISHELRTPVGAISLLAETIGDETDPATIRRLAGRIELEALRLSGMVNDVLSLSRLESDEPHTRDLVDMVGLAESAVDRAKQRSGENGLELRLVVESGDEQRRPVVNGDRLLLATALDNLLANAVTYSDKGLPVEVRLSLEPSGDRVRIDVVDQGIGIPLRERQRIFERFYRVDRSRTRDSGGSGIGLAIVRHIAVNHDGSIEVDSLEGVGSTFTLRLPVERPSSRSGAASDGGFGSPSGSGSPAGFGSPSGTPPEASSGAMQ